MTKVSRFACVMVGKRGQAVIAVFVALYSASLYRDRHKLRSFPLVARHFFGVGWSLERMPSLAGKVALVTGANSGLGLQSARAMHAAGAHVVMACRDPRRCAEAMATLDGGAAGAGSAETLPCDLASLRSTRGAARAFLQRRAKLDILLLNAGGMFAHALTADGIETTFQVSHVGHFLLAKLLLPALKAAAPSRVVSVTSDAHQYSYSSGIAGLPDLEAINDAARANAAQNYAQAKLANVLFATELTKRLDAEAANGDHAARQVYVNSCHPGLVTTKFIYGLLRRVLGWTEATAQRVDGWLRWAWTATGMAFDEVGGSVTQLFLCCAPEVEQRGIRGRYYVPVAGESPFDAHVLNATLGRALWEMSEELVAPFAV